MIEYLERIVIYDNPKPHVRSRHGYFPGVIKLPSGDLLALFALGEAFESADNMTWLSRSCDGGATWQLQGPLYSKPSAGTPTSDYLKATLLSDGSLLAMGYRFHRADPEQGIGIGETGGILPGDNVVCFSRDRGHTWSAPQVIGRCRPELLEISGPALQLQSGDLLAVAAPYKMPDGTNPSGQIGVLLRSRDGGKSWDDSQHFFTTEHGDVSPFESRICQMSDGLIVALVWAYDTRSDRHHPNHYVISRDDGRSWSTPTATPHMGQASGLLGLSDGKLLTIHAHRSEDVGIYVRLVDLAGDRWCCIGEQAIYGARQRLQTRDGQPMAEMFTALRFGQPSLVQLDAREFLAVHWAIEDGQGKILAHRLRITNA